MPVGKALITLLGMLMAREISTLKKAVEFASSETVMGGNGKDPDVTYKSITFNRTELRDSAHSKREGLHM